MENVQEGLNKLRSFLWFKPLQGEDRSQAETIAPVGRVDDCHPAGGERHDDSQQDRSQDQREGEIVERRQAEASYEIRPATP